jgi:hypothetical protein
VSHSDLNQPAQGWLDGGGLRAQAPRESVAR